MLLLLLSLINQMHLLVGVRWLLIGAGGQPAAVTLTGRYLARDGVCLRFYRGQALSLQLLHRVIHTVAQGKLVLALLYIDVQGVKILNDAARVSRLTNSLYTALIIVTVRALVVDCQTAKLLLLVGACHSILLLRPVLRLLSIIVSLLTLFL